MAANGQAAETRGAEAPLRSQDAKYIMDIRNEGEEEQTLMLAAKAVSCEIDITTYSARLRIPAVRARFSLMIWEEQRAKHLTVLLPACTWCGMPTNHCCSMCEATGTDPGMAICTESCLGKISNHCRLCFEKIAEVRVEQ